MAFERPNARIFFDQAEYEEEGSQDGSGSSGTSVTSAGTTRSERDILERDFPLYVPPHRRGVDLEMGERTVVFRSEDDPDRKQGVENNKFQRLHIAVHFALTKVMITLLHVRFPGMYFTSRGQNNHDHPISHVVTQVGTKLLQRLIPSGARILDVYGNPRACMRFNASQSKATTPKKAVALVANFGGPDFIREINKWGAIDDNGVDAYFKGTIRNHAARVGFADYDVFQMIHTLYYCSVNDVMRLVHSGKGRKVLALVHHHPKDAGFINAGEQQYWKKGGSVKQKNLATGSCYYHPDISGFYFGEDKTYWSDDVDYKGLGLVWELHTVCEDTWIIEIVGTVRSEIETDGFVDFKAMYEEAEATFSDSDLNVSYRGDIPCALPTRDGRFISLDICSVPLFDKLRSHVAGKKRDPAMFAELLRIAKQAINPGAMFPGAVAIDCPANLIVDHVIGAAYVDLEKEIGFFDAGAQVADLVRIHAMQVSGSRIRSPTLAALVDSLRGVVSAAVAVNRVVKSEDKVGRAFGALHDALV